MAGRRAEKLLERMRRSKSGWRSQDLIRLYRGFGFDIRNGRGHDVITHSAYPTLRQTLPRRLKDSTPYVIEAIKMIDNIDESKDTLGK